MVKFSKRIFNFLQNEIIWIIAIFILSFSLRMIYMQQSQSNPLFAISAQDIEQQVEQWHAPKPFYRTPLPLYIIDILLNICAKNTTALKFVFFLIGSINCILIYFVAKKVFNKTIGLISSVIACLYGPFIFFEGIAADPVLAISAGLIFLLLVLNTFEKPNKYKWFICGIFWGLSILLRHHFFLFGIIILGYLIFLFKQKKNNLFMIYSISFLLGFIITIAPITLRNVIIGKDFVIIGYSAGIAFWHGNNPEYEKLHDRATGFGWHDIFAMPFREIKSSRMLSGSDTSRYFFKKAFQFIHTQPVAYLKLQLKKLYVFWNGYEEMGDEDIYTFRQYSPLLAKLVGDKLIYYPFGIIGPLAILGMMFSARISRKATLLTIMCISCMMLDILMAIQSRYLVATAPFLIIVASYTLWWWYQKIAHRQQKKAVLISVILFLTLVYAFNFKHYELNDINKARIYYKLAGKYKAQGKINLAITELEKAVETFPENPETKLRMYLIDLYTRTGRIDDAINEYRKILALKPLNPSVRIALAGLLEKKGRINEAIFEYNEGIKQGLPPSQQMQAHYQLGVIFKKQGKYNAAIDEFIFLVKNSRGVNRFKSYAINGHYNLAEVYEITNKPDMAIKEYEEIIKLQPDSPNRHFIDQKIELLTNRANP